MQTARQDEEDKVIRLALAFAVRSCEQDDEGRTMVRVVLRSGYATVGYVSDLDRAHVAIRLNQPSGGLTILLSEIVAVGPFRG